MKSLPDQNQEFITIPVAASVVDTESNRDIQYTATNCIGSNFTSHAWGINKTQADRIMKK